MSSKGRPEEVRRERERNRDARTREERRGEEGCWGGALW